MAHEKLMQELPKDIERVSPQGPFYIRWNSGNRNNDGPSCYSVVVLKEVLVTFGGPNAKEDATKLSQTLNRANKRYHRQYDEQERRRRAKTISLPANKMV